MNDLGLARAVQCAGGLFDVFTPRLPENLKKICGANEGAYKLTRELLRALGGSLIAIGVAVAYLVFASGPNPDPAVLVVVLLFVLPAELAALDERLYPPPPDASSRPDRSERSLTIISVRYRLAPVSGRNRSPIPARTQSPDASSCISQAARL